MFSQSEDEAAGVSILITTSSSEDEEDEQVKPKNEPEAKSGSLSQQVFLGLQVTGLHCPPVSTPLLYSSQPPVFIQATLSQPESQQRHSNFLPLSAPQQGPEPLKITQGNCIVLPVNYNTVEQSQALNVPPLAPVPRKKPRTHNSTEHLEAMFQEDPFPDRERKQATAAAVGVTPQNIKLQNQGSGAWNNAVTGEHVYGWSAAGSTPRHQMMPTLPTQAHSSLGAPPVSHWYNANPPQFAPGPPAVPTLSTQMAPYHSSFSSPGPSRGWEVSPQGGLVVYPTHPMPNPPPMWQSSLPFFQAGMAERPDPEPSQSVYLGVGAPGLRYPPVPTPPLYSSQPTFLQAHSSPGLQSVPQQGPEVLENRKARAKQENTVTAQFGLGQSAAGSTPQHQISPTLPTQAHSSLGAPPVSYWYNANPPQLAPGPPAVPTLSTQMAPSHSSFSSPDSETDLKRNNPKKRKVTEVEERLYSQSEDDDAEETEMSDFITSSDTKPPVSIKSALPPPQSNQQLDSADQQFLDGLEVLFQKRKVRAKQENTVLEFFGLGQSAAGSTPQHQISPTLPTQAHSSLGAPPVSHSCAANPPQLAPGPPSSTTSSTQMAPSHSSLSSPGQSRDKDTGQQQLSSRGGVGGVSHPSVPTPPPLLHATLPPFTNKSVNPTPPKSWQQGRE